MNTEELTERLEKLPLRAIVAFASRCARRLQPLFDLASEIPNFRHRREALEFAIQTAETFACGVTKELSSFAEDNARAAANEVERYGAVIAAQSAAHAATDAAEAARAAFHATADDAEEAEAAHLLAASSAAEAAHEFEREGDGLKSTAYNAAAKAVLDDAIRDAAERDLGKLESLSESHPRKGLGRKKNHRRKRKSVLGDPIDPSETGALGPLWRDGEPDGFRAKHVVISETGSAFDAGAVVKTDVVPPDIVEPAMEYHHSPLTIYVDAGAADAETIRDLFLALSAVYEAQGGSGLKIVKHRQRTLVGEEVPV